MLAISGGKLSVFEDAGTQREDPSERQRPAANTPSHPAAWLELADECKRRSDDTGALLAQFEAVTCAQQGGLWLDEASTPPELLSRVVDAIAQVRTRRNDIYRCSYADLRELHGQLALERVDHALDAYLKKVVALPTDAHQRPRFFYFPDLPSAPYLDPSLHRWTATLTEAYPAIREEFLRLLSEEAGFEDFIRVRTGDSLSNYLGGKQPSWEAFFFYRHGKRYEDNHARCPVTSAALSAIDLCQIEGHAPEICFSVLAPGTEILPHYGVTNVRTVLHLPLVVPGQCALNVRGGGVHQWDEGKLLMFDDTFEHEAWNRSSQLRGILLMDCWNPYLTPVECQAVSRLIRCIGMFHRTARTYKT
jgi:aspartate beta-hydroxylase